VEMQPGYCSITWSAAAGDMYGFTVTGDTNMAVGDGTVGTSAGALSDGDCTTDFVVIPNPSYVNSSLMGPNTDRFCGNGFNSVTSKNKFYSSLSQLIERIMGYVNRCFSILC
jgi:hypothetical protein